MLRNSVFNLSAVAAALFLSGCVAVGPDYHAPETTTVAVQTKQNVALTEREQLWWQHFDDAALNTLVDRALANNPSLDIARANVSAAYALFDDVDNDDYLIGDVGLDYSAQDQAAPGFIDQRFNARSYRAGANLSWNLDLFGKLERAAQAARADAESQFYAWQDVQIELVAQIARTYGEYKGAQARIEVAQRNIDSLQKTREVILYRVEAGFASDLDRLRIDAQLKGVEATIPALKAESDRLFNTLAALSGTTPDAFLIEQTQWDLPQLDKPLAIGEPTELLRRRADLHQAERQLAAATARVGSRTAALYPDLSVTGFVGFLSGSAGALGNQTRAWSVAPSLSWPAFDLRSVEAQLDIANAEERAAFARFRQQLLAVLSEAQTSLDVYAQTQQQLHLLQEQVSASEQSLSLAQLQYEAGSIDLLDLLDVERTLLAAKDNLALAQIRVFTDIVEVYRSFGGGLSAADRPATQPKADV